MASLFENKQSIFDTDISVDLPLSSIDQVIHDSSFDLSKIHDIVGPKGAKIRFFPDKDTALKALDEDSTTVFKIIIGGTDVGDVIIGDTTSGNYVQWDNSAATLTVNGTIVATGGTIGGWKILADYLYSLASGTPTSSPNNGIVMRNTNPALIVYEGTNKRIEFGYLSSGVFGLKGYATDGTTVLFELSDTQNILAGWTVGATTFANGTNIILDASNKAISINDATYGNSGIQFQYNAGTPRAYIGNGTTQYLKYDGTQISWATPTTSLDTAGKLTTTSASIGGWQVSSSAIYYDGAADANSAGMALADYPFYAGKKYADRATAPFRVTPAGALYASSATVSGAITAGVGSSLPTTYLSGEVALANLNVANRGWSQSSIFSVTDADTVAWGAGTFTAADGTTYSIGAGNTGNMSAKTYIYLDTAVSTTTYQITSTAATSVGAGKCLVAIAQNGTGEATYAVLYGQGGQNIDAASIVAGSITANEIATGTITADRMNVSQLSAIAANLGSITSGTVTGATVQTAASGARVLMNTDYLIGYDASSNVRFKFYISGTDVGDVDIGNYSGNQGVKYDASVDSFDFKGTIAGKTFITPLAIEYGENLTAGDALSTIHSDAAYGSNITTSQDTYINEAAGTTNYDTVTILVQASPGSPNNTRSMFKFATGWPTDILRIISFDLVINVLSGGGSTVTVNAIDASWDSTTVTWNTKPNATSNLGSLALAASGSQTINCTVADTSTDYTITNKIKNYGLMLIGGYANIEALENAGTTPAYITNLVYLARDGKIWKSDATYGESVNEFVGFCQTTGNAGDTTKPILYSGILTTSGLTGGSTYYLSDTKGAISTSAGTNSKKVGRAVGTTYLMIKNDND